MSTNQGDPQKIYTHQDLIHLYLALRKDDYLHDDLKMYDQQLYNHISALFDVYISLETIEDPEHRVLWFVFRSAVDAYNNAHSFGHTLVDSSLIFKKLESLPEIRQFLESHIEIINSNTVSIRQRSMEIVLSLFHLFYTPKYTSITSEQLKEHGFDVKQQPNIAHYYDFL